MKTRRPRKAQKLTNFKPLQDEVLRLREEVTELREWKRQQMEVTAPILEYMQGASKKFNLQLGDSVFKKVLAVLRKSDGTT